MKKLLTVILLVAVLVTAVAALASCKKDDAEQNPTITVGYTLYEPMNYKDANGTLVGFDTELAKAVFEKLGYEVIFKEIKWESKYTDLNTGTIDCVWNGFTSNSNEDDGTARSQLVDFSYNYMLNAQSIVVKADKVAEYTDKTTSFVGKTGYVEAGSAGKSYSEELTGATVKEATKQTDAIMQIKSNAADFAVVDYLLAKSLAGKGDYADLAYIEALSSDVEYYAIAFKKGSEMTAKVNATLKELAADGTIANIAKTYGLDNSIITDFSAQDK